MDIIQIREYCLSLPGVTEDQAFGEEFDLLRVQGHIFCCVCFERPDLVTLKCNPDYAIDLRDRYLSAIEGAWHWNKKYWNQLLLPALDDDLVRHLIRHSYNQVLSKLSAPQRGSLTLLTE